MAVYGVEPTAAPKVYGYARVSTDKQADEGQSLAVQQRQIEGWCLMHGHQLTHMYVEAGTSASVPLEKRPQGALLLNRLCNGDTIISTKLDRMFRSVHDASGMIERFAKRNIGVALLDTGGLVTTDAAGKVTFHLLVSIAQFERERTSERIKDVKRDQKARQRYLGGKVPFGYRVDPLRGLVAYSKEQDAIADLIALVGQMSIRQATLAVVARHHVKLSHETASKLVRSLVTA